MRQMLLLGIPTVILLAFVSATGVAPPFVWTNTRYAPGYSESRFKKIKPGAPVDRVLVDLGKPLAHFTNAWEEKWTYRFSQARANNALVQIALSHKQ